MVLYANYIKLYIKNIIYIKNNYIYMRGAMQSAMLKKPLSACRMHLNLLGRAR